MLFSRQKLLSDQGASRMIIRTIRYFTIFDIISVLSIVDVSECNGVESAQVRDAVALACAMLNGGNSDVQKVDWMRINLFINF